MSVCFTWESILHLLGYSVSLQHDLLYTLGQWFPIFFPSGTPSVAKKNFKPPYPNTHVHILCFQTPLRFILHLLINPNCNFLFFLDKNKQIIK